MNSEMNTSQKLHIKYQLHRTKIGSIIVQENSQKSLRHVNQTKISAHAIYPLQNMKLPQNSCKFIKKHMVNFLGILQAN